MWFAFKLVSLNHWKQPFYEFSPDEAVVICFQISIFEPLKTAQFISFHIATELWFAFKLVSLNHWKQRQYGQIVSHTVVICFQISIFEPLKTAYEWYGKYVYKLWFAFKLVSLNHWKQRYCRERSKNRVVICFQISIFEPLKTANRPKIGKDRELWFAFKLVSLNHWKQPNIYTYDPSFRCDLLSN